MSWLDKYKISVPEGVSGEWAVEQFTVDEEAAKLERIRAIFSGSGRGCGLVGDYTKLVHGGVVIMSDTPDEIRDHIEPITKSKGICLINGLGLGVVLNGMLARDSVEHVHVVEVSRDVLNLVEPHYRGLYGDRFTIHHADALEWRPPKGLRFDVVWHDIWSTICIDNLPDMHKLHRRYGRRTDWQGSWARWICERERRLWGC